jgi:hypothetical protein
MKKTILTLGLGLALNFTASAQWTYKTVSDDFDGSFKIAYTESNNDAWLKLQASDGDVAFFIRGGYYCGEKPTVDLIFLVNGEPKKYTVTGITSSDRKIVFIDLYLNKSDMLESFKNASSVKIRINQDVCTDDTYIFNMKNSGAAFDFIK